MAQGRPNKIILMIQWIRTGKLSKKKSLSLARTASEPHSQRSNTIALALTQACPPQEALSLSLPLSLSIFLSLPLSHPEIRCAGHASCTPLRLEECMPPRSLPTWIGECQIDSLHVVRCAIPLESFNGRAQGYLTYKKTQPPGPYRMPMSRAL